MDYTDYFHSQHKILKKIYTILHMIADFMAALLFLIGSIMFLYPEWVDRGTWLFIIGSLLFLMKPAIKLTHDLHLDHLNKKVKLKGTKSPKSKKV